MVVTKRTISQILKIEESDEWKIYDRIEEKGLYLIHANRGFEMNWPDLHGVIVDVPRKMVVCKSFRFSSLATSDKLEVDENGTLSVLDSDGKNHHFLDKMYSIKYSFDGVIIRVFKHDGVVYYSSHKKIDASNSRWVDTDDFVTMYHCNGGPSGDLLFGLETEFSPWVYTFIIVDPDLLVATRQNIQHGYVVFTGVESMWDLNKSPIDEKESGLVEMEPVKIPLEKEFPLIVTYPGVYAANNISLEQANNNLRYGFEELQTYDKRLGSGEAVIIYAFDNNGKITDILRVMSTAFTWRTEMRSNTHNIYHQLVLLSTKANLDFKSRDNLGDYKNAFPTIPFLNKVKVLKQFEHGFVTDVVIDSLLGEKPPGHQIKTLSSRLINLQFCFLFSLPLSFQASGVKAIKRYYTDKQKVTKFITEIMNGNLEKEEEDDDRTWQRIATIARQSGQARKNPYNEHLSIYGRKIAKIKYTIDKEYGTSLYKMITLLRQREKRQKRSEEEKKEKENNKTVEEN